MKTLLRCLFCVEATDQKSQVLLNYRHFLDAGLGFDVPEYSSVWEYIQQFVQQHNHVPQVESIRTHFKHIGDDSVSNVLETLVGLKIRDRGDFDTYLGVKIDQYRMRLWTEVMKESGTIGTTGLTFKDDKGKERILRGPEDAVRYMLDRSPEILAPNLSTRLSGEVRADAQDFIAEYERVEADPLAGIGQFCYIKQIDDALAGAKRHELWLHAAFTGGLKSTFGLNWAYSQAVYFGHGSVFFSLEMPYSQVRRILYSMHSGHPKFRAIRYKLGLQDGPDEDVGLPYQEIRDGTLKDFHPNGRKFLMDYVIPDFFDPENSPVQNPDPNGYEWPRQYGKIHIEVADPNKNDFTVTDIRNRAEVIYSENPFSSIYIDHAGLVAPRKSYRSTTESLNEVIRDLKKLAMSFKRGMGIAVIAFFQISREGFKAALKAKEKTGKAGFNLTHLSYANEAERCIIQGTYVRTPQGFSPVGSVSQQSQTASSSGWKSVENIFDNGVRRIWDVITDRGSILSATAPHRVQIVSDGHLIWCAVKDLSDKYVTGMFGGDFWPSDQVALPPLVVKKGEKGAGQQGIDLTTPTALTPELAYLLGAWDGDGKVHAGGLAWTGNRKEKAVRERLRDAFLETFNHSLTLQESPSRLGSFDLVKWSLPLKRWFESVAGKRGQTIPDCVLGAPRDLVCAYLQGLFDSDGWINNQGVTGIKMKRASKPFLRVVQMLLTALSIDSHLSDGKGYLEATQKTYENVTLRIRSREGMLCFQDRIGFTEPWKQCVLQEHLGRKTRDTQRYPVPQTFLSAYSQVHPKGSHLCSFPRSFHNVPARVRKTGVVPRGAVRLLVGYADQNGIHSPEIKFLKKLLDLHVMKVISVRDTGRKESVMDLEVTGDHEYQTGPLLSHNSSDIVTASWVDDDLRDANRVLFQCLKSRDQKPFEPFQARVEFTYRRILTCYDVPRTAMDMAQKGADMDKAQDELDG